MLNFNWNKKHTIIAVSIGVYAVLAMLFLIIINSEKIYSWVNNILSVLAPLIIGVAIAYICNPLMMMFENRAYSKINSHKIRRVLSLICTYLVLALGITVILLIVIPQLQNSYNSFAGNLKNYTDKAITFVNKLIYRFDMLTDNDNFENYINITDVQQKVAELFTNSSNLLSTIANYVVSYAATIAVGVKNTLFGLFISIYILSSKERILAKIKMCLAALLSESRYSSLSEWVKFTNDTFGNYIKAQLLDACLVAIECAIVFSITGIPYSILLAFIIGVTNIIPIFGPFIGGIPAGFIVFISRPEKLLLFIILIVLIQQIDGNFVLPRLVGTTTGMTSLGVLCAITIMGGFFGIAGMILGIPFFVVTGEIIRRIVNSKLEKRGMSVSLADYAGESGSAAIEQEAEDQEKDNLFVKTVKFEGKLIRRIWERIKSLFKRKKK